jgi:MGT family glycosyltransferase
VRDRTGRRASVGASDAQGVANRPLRLLLGAFGDPGHAFPMIALGERLAQRGHTVTLQTWTRWREHVEAAGMSFSAAPEYQVFPTRDRPLKPYEAAVRAARESQPLVRETDPDVVIADILTLAPALAGELEERPVVTVVPHLLPHLPPIAPPYSLGARPARTPLGRAAWRALRHPFARGLSRGRDELNGARQRLGLAPLPHVHGGISRQLCLVATLPALEPWAGWPPWAHVVGPLLWEPPAEDVALPDGEAPLVLVAPSTSQDRRHHLLHAAVRGLADGPVRVLATWNRRPPREPLEPASNTRVVPWVSYRRTMPSCDVVVCHGGHGTVMRALASGCVVVASPAAGDMNENAARLDWAGLGVRLPKRLLSPATLRLAVERALADERLRANARAAADWATHNDGATRAAELIEAFAARAPDRAAA